MRLRSHLGDNHELLSVFPHHAGDFREIAQLDISHNVKKGRLPILLEASRRLRIVFGQKSCNHWIGTGLLTTAASPNSADIIQTLGK